MREIRINRAKEQSYRLNDVWEADKAYIKQETINNERVWSIYNGQGEQMGYAADRQIAFALVCQNELTPLSVH